MKLRERLDELRALAKGATPGNWGTSIEIDGYMAGKRSVVQKLHGLRITTVGQTRPHDTDHAEANAALIAAMRNAIPALLEVVEQQHKALEAMVREFGYEVVHPQGLVHDEHEAIRKATAALSLMDKEVK